MLEQELKTFEEHKDQLLTTDEGRFVLIKGEQVVRTFESEMDAIEDGYRRFGNVAFLVKQILQVEPIVYLSSNLIGT